MSIDYALSMTAHQHKLLRYALYPGDRREAVALLVCGRRAGDYRHRLVVREVYPLFERWYQERTGERVTWSTDALEPILDIAEQDGLSIVKVHSHPSGYPRFSDVDDVGDRRLLPAIRDWLERDWPHGSAVMLPDGQMFGRVLTADSRFAPFQSVMVVGDDIKLWFADAPGTANGDFCASHAQAFGSGTTDILRKLTVAVVGCSGTGSPVVEQLARLGIKRLILVDDDIVEERNLNRVLYATKRHALSQTPKVDVVADGIANIGIGTEIIPLNSNLATTRAIDIVAEADIIFGCMDSIEGRFMLNRLATYYTLPYFDLGVRLLADGNSSVDEVCGTIHYLQPGKSSLISRGLFTLADVATDGLRRRDPDAYRQQIKDGYIRGATEQRPAVIAVNMLAASLAVNELLARLHPFRDEANVEFGSVGFSLASMELYADPESDVCSLLQRHVGRGDIEPRLGLLQFAQGNKQ